MFAIFRLYVSSKAMKPNLFLLFQKHYGSKDTPSFPATK